MELLVSLLLVLLERYFNLLVALDKTTDAPLQAESTNIVIIIKLVRLKICFFMSSSKYLYLNYFHELWLS